MRRVVMLIAVSVLGAALVVAAGALLVPSGDRSPVSRETAREADPIAWARSPPPATTSRPRCGTAAPRSRWIRTGRPRSASSPTP